MHSDQGSQFSSHNWQSFLKTHNLIRSMSRRRLSRQRRRRELLQLLKRERIRRRIYADREEARRDVFDYIEMFYNPKRRHSYAEGFFRHSSNRSISIGSKVSIEIEMILPSVFLT